MLEIPKEAFEKKVLDPIEHMKLCRDIERYAALGGIAPRYIWTPVRDRLTDDEVNYLKNCRILAKQGVTCGLVYVGSQSVADRFAAMTGALIRSFVNARLQTTAQIIEQMKDGDEPEATVLFIPNFFEASEFGKFDTSKAHLLGDILTRRAARYAQTVVHVESEDEASSRFSTSVMDLLKQNFVHLTTGGLSV